MDFAVGYDVRLETDFSLHRIREAIPLPEYRLRITFDDGVSGEVDMKPVIDKGGVFTALADPRRFEQVQIAPSGRYIFWPDELDLCADALYIQIKHDMVSQPD